MEAYIRLFGSSPYPCPVVGPVHHIAPSTLKPLSPSPIRDGQWISFAPTPWKGSKTDLAYLARGLFFVFFLQCPRNQQNDTELAPVDIVLS